MRKQKINTQISTLEDTMENINKSMGKPTLGKNISWNTIERKFCRVVKFQPLARVENGKIIEESKLMPYAVLSVECEKLSEQATLPITHKIDFINLLSVFKERTISEKEEVIIVYSPRYKKSFSAILPKLIVLVYPKGSFNKFTDPNWKPKSGETGYLEMKPIVELKPEVLE